MENAIPSNWILHSPNLKTIVEFATQASKLEIQTELKPGNVNPTQSVGKTTYQHFLLAIDAIKNSYLKIIDETASVKIPSNTTFGPVLYQAVNSMMEAQSGGNVLLGHILLFTPLIWTCKKWFDSKDSTEPLTWTKFWTLNPQTLDNATSEDGVWLSRAITRAQPGGLNNPGGKPLQSEFDFTRSDIEQQIITHGKTFEQLFAESATFDAISAEMISNYSFSREILTTWIIQNQANYSKASNKIVDLFLHILSRQPDSLIFRKNSLEIAKSIQNDAKIIIELGGIRTQEGKKKILELNQRLMAANGKLNPGTTADLTACILFLSLIFNCLVI